MREAYIIEKSILYKGFFNPNYILGGNKCELSSINSVSYR